MTLHTLSSLATTKDAIRVILERNYTALGWRLGKLEVLTGDSLDGAILRGTLHCPCGGTEYFSSLMDPAGFTLDQASSIATDILGNTASRAHLQRDVDEGKLPAMDVDKHAFKGILL